MFYSVLVNIKDNVRSGINAIEILRLEAIEGRTV